jgi:exosome complex component RRP41
MRGDRSGPEWVSPEGLRVDGRRPAELRRMKVSLGVLSRGDGNDAAADGSARVDAGNTKVRLRVLVFVA